MYQFVHFNDGIDNASFLKFRNPIIRVIDDEKKKSEVQILSYYVDY